MRGVRRALLLAVLLGGQAAAQAAADPDTVQALYLKAVTLMTEGRQEAASDAFEQLIALEPQHAGAWLELAINHCTMGHASAAEKLFREIEVRFAPSAAILAVIDRHRQQGCRAPRVAAQAALTLARGHDSNVNQGASNPVFVTGSGAERIESLLSDDFLPQADGYSQATVDYLRALGAPGLVGFGQLRLRRYDHLRGQDTNAMLLGLDRSFSVGRWPSHATITAGAVGLGGALYQRQLHLQARTAPPLPLPAPFALNLSAALGEVAYVSRENFDARSAELAAQLLYKGRQVSAQGGFGRVSERGDSGRLGGDRHGWYASALLQGRAAARLDSELGWTRQDWQGQRAYAPGLIDSVRQQSTRQWRAALAWSPAAHQQWQLEWRHVRNQENISLFQYNSHMLQLNWRWDGF